MNVSGRNLKCFSPGNRKVWVNNEFSKLTMSFSESSQMSIHAVFPGHLGTLRKVVYFLISSKWLVNLALDVRTCPTNGPVLVLLSSFSEAVVLEGVSDQADVDPVVKLEEVALVLRPVGPKCHGVDVWAEDEKLLLLDIIYSLSCLQSLLKGKVKFTWFVHNLHLLYLFLHILSCLAFLFFGFFIYCSVYLRLLVSSRDGCRRTRFENIWCLLRSEPTIISWKRALLLGMLISDPVPACCLRTWLHGRRSSWSSDTVAAVVSDRLFLILLQPSVSFE